MNIKLSEREIRNAILSAFEKKNSWYRKELVNECLLAAGVGQEALRDRNYNSNTVYMKNQIGSVISKLIESGDIVLDAAKQLSVSRDIGIVLRDDEIRAFVLDSLAAAPTPKKRLYVAAEKHFGTDKTPDRADDNELRSAVGNVLTKLVAENAVDVTADGMLSLAADEGELAVSPVKDLVGIVGDDAAIFAR